MGAETIGSEKVYRGKVFDVLIDTIREGDKEYQREIVTHNGSCVIVPVFADQRVALVKQYRHPARDYLYEIPAGTLKAGEKPETGARRELEEEVGVVANRIEKLTEFYVSPGFLNEKMYLFLAAEFTETAQNLDEDETIEIEKFTFPEAFEMIRRNEIVDAKTMVGLIMAGTRFGFVFE
ncbi:MAG: NUDIX hydrolase [Pyrinomonadaceae bacterium]